jgi:hypothetical protein
MNNFLQKKPQKTHKFTQKIFLFIMADATTYILIL